MSPFQGFGNLSLMAFYNNDIPSGFSSCLLNHFNFYTPPLVRASAAPAIPP